MKITNNCFHASICESTCVHREIVKKLVLYGIILIHSAVVAVDGIAYAFLAKSGVGKSTHIRLWQELFKNRSIIVNGDKPMFSFCGDILTVHGTPWKGKENEGENISLPVGGICFIERSESNKISKASKNDIINRLFHQVLLPDNEKDLDIFLNIIEKIIATIPIFKLECNMEAEAAVIAYNAMNISNNTGDIP